LNIPKIDPNEISTEWEVLNSESSSSFTNELYREICRGHKLYKINSVALLKRNNRDDYIFYTENNEYALIHLTWQKESNPNWPYCSTYKTIQECLAELE